MARRLVQKADVLIGAKVRNPQSEDLGRIEDLMVDLEAGRITYAVLSFGGFLGIGDKWFAIPWEALSPAEDADVFILDIPRETLERAPGFDKDNPPDMSGREYAEAIYVFYGYDPYW